MACGDYTACMTAGREANGCNAGSLGFCPQPSVPSLPLQTATEQPQQRETTIQSVITNHNLGTSLQLQGLLGLAHTTLDLLLEELSVFAPLLL